MRQEVDRLHRGTVEFTLRAGVGDSRALMRGKVLPQSRLQRWKELVSGEIPWKDSPSVMVFGGTIIERYLLLRTLERRELQAIFFDQEQARTRKQLESVTAVIVLDCEFLSFSECETILRLKEARAHLGGGEIPIVGIGSSPYPHSRHSPLALIFSAYITKPVLRHELYSHIESISSRGEVRGSA